MNFTAFYPVILLLFLLGFGTAASAQFQFEKGYVVTTKGDTLRGKIKYGRRYELSLRCFFTKDGDDEPTKYKPFEIRSYFVKGETFDSKIYDYDPTGPVGEGAFMQRINEGACKIYYYWNSDKDVGFTQTFIEKSGVPLTEVHFFHFRKQMSAFFKDFDQLSAKIEMGEYRGSQLEEVVKEYNTYKQRLQEAEAQP